MLINALIKSHTHTFTFPSSSYSTVHDRSSHGLLWFDHDEKVSQSHETPSITNGVRWVSNFWENI